MSMAQLSASPWASPRARIYFRRLFGMFRRRPPRGWIESEGGVGKALLRPVFETLRIDAGLRHISYGILVMAY